jgi:uncharacterized ubiquitin-like protein YukD
MSQLIRVTVGNQADGKHAELLIPAALTAAEVIKRLVASKFLENGAAVLRVSGSRRLVPCEQSLQEAGIKDGDSLLVTYDDDCA